MPREPSGFLPPETRLPVDLIHVTGGAYNDTNPLKVRVVTEAQIDAAAARSKVGREKKTPAK